MSTIENKILDGPTAHYCDAEDDDIRTGEDTNHDRDNSEFQMIRNDVSSLFVRSNEDTDTYPKQARISCVSSNTGPKGVIEDFKKQSLTSGRQDTFLSDDLEAEFKQLLSDDTILKEYAEKRLAQMSEKIPLFGQVLRLQTGSDLLDAVDKEQSNVLVMVHIYTKFSRPCARVDQCLDELATDLKHIKFVTLEASVAGLSSNFKDNGVPALLAYRGGNLVKSLVQLEDLLDKDFDVNQLKDLLVENKLI